jgi:Tannase and feruloyl esterase
MRLRNRLALAAFAAILTNVIPARAQQACETLKDIKLDHTSILSAAMVNEAPLKPVQEGPFERVGVTVPRHCEVTGVSRPTSDSEIAFMVWLPPKESWNGKYLQRGNGGWAGAIESVWLVAPLTRGYAVAATDDGHHAEGVMPDASWAIGHPEKLKDFGYRALHETAVVSKHLVQVYYGKTSAHAYFTGCSDGGREALMEAERYPEDFDGILAGAPANNWTHHFTGFIWNEIALNAKPESKITAEQLPAIQKAALAACDALDGVQDGGIEDPRKCHFDPSVLLCHGASGPSCLTQPQIDAVKKIYAGPRNPKTGEQIYPGYAPGTEADPGGWGLWLLDPALQAPFGNSFFGQVVYEQAQWDWHTMDFDRDVRLADEKTAEILNAYNPDLRSFRDHGGKLIQYHGWGDTAIAPQDSINFYEKVDAFLKRYPDPRSSNSADIQTFYRLFMVPGLQHCWGGPGAVSFGNDEIGALKMTSDDADHDILLALDLWVTQGKAPDRIVATGMIGADPNSGINNAASHGTPLTRPLCPYPAVARYKGQGDTNAAENFECIQESAK